MTREEMKKQSIRDYGSKARLWDRSKLQTNSVFPTRDGARYGVHRSGAFVRVNKDRRSVKERKKARREAREEREKA